MIPKSVHFSLKSACYAFFLLLTVLLLCNGCSKDTISSVIEEEESTEEDGTTDMPANEDFNADINQDGTLNILLLGPSTSIKSDVSAFSLESVANELTAILSEDETINTTVNVVYEDTYKAKELTVGLGSDATNQYQYTHYAHSLLQYYYWPEGETARRSKLKGEGENDWDYVVIAADPYIVSKIPGFYALGVNKIASTVAEGNAKPLLLMLWPKDEQNTASITDFEEFTYRTAEGGITNIEVIPAGLAWEGLPSELKDWKPRIPQPTGLM